VPCGSIAVMPLPTSVVGASTDPVTHEIDERWTMAYAAGIGDLSPAYLDTRAADGLVAHPVFPVCLEWPLVLAARRLVPADVLPRHEAARGIHATHDLRIHRLVQPGDVLTTTAVVEGIEQRSPGAYEVLKLTTWDAAGKTVCTTRMGSLFLGVTVDGDDRPATDPSTVVPALSATDHASSNTVTRAIDGGAAHTYTECSRIWNPIHTDPAVAAAAGLPGIILHGTATLATAVSEIVRRRADGDPRAVRRVTCRFGAMVPMPSTIEVRVGARRSPAVSDHLELVPFEVRNQAGERAIRDGVVFLGTPPD
jgi:acyl dehydratase